MPCMQAFLAFAVSWPKLDKVKDLLIGLCVICVALLLLPKFYMLLELVLLLNCTVCSSRSFFFLNLHMAVFVFVFLFAERQNELLVHDDSLYSHLSYLRSVQFTIFFLFFFRRHASQLVTVQSASWSSEALAFSLRANGKRRGSNWACSCPQQVHGLVLATSRFE